MQKYISTTIGIALLPFVCAIATFKSVIAQEYSGCFLITTAGTVVELNKLCTLNDEQTAEPLEFSGLEFQPPIAGLKSAGIQGSVTNRSNKVILLKTIYFQLLANNRVVAASNIQVETGNGLQPGESLSFNAGIGSSIDGLPEDGVKVEVIKYE
ncbi:FxLYD domain-containing protein [Aliterella atlantica]|uniref:Uncharacterized protein n=1 Tax=Aliterella atlantica CENA595 TaxID=1618023 RepID=A0A0D8ZPR3_9CYAN|nr:FxLYD domain-containing protein [Aliterella atlantica]KJH70710.1 hypothetical protein UH38_16820 [Aliterella atlantica CENA595]